MALPEQSRGFTVQVGFKSQLELVQLSKAASLVLHMLQDLSYPDTKVLC